MVFADGFVGLVLFGVWIFCIIDAITTDPAQVRNLPKAVWIIIVILLVDLGSLLWLIAGRNWSNLPRLAHPSNATGFPVDRPKRRVATNPDDDEDFLRGVRERAEQQRRSYEQRRTQEVADEQDRLRGNRDDPDAPSPN
jgi:hypothetical protein